ncbi:hypothetical protein BVY00_00450 [bacterium G20]|nr:hypothetical protein BVY00_00450 [bacterium G20]
MFGRSRKMEANGRTPTVRASQKPSPRYYRAPQKPSALSPFQRKPSVGSPKRRTLVFRRVKNVLIVFLIIFGLIYSLTIKPQPNVVVNDTSYHSLSDYKVAAQSAFKAWRNRSKLTLDEKGISSAMKHQFPEISSLELTVSTFSQIPTVKLAIAAPTFNLSSNAKLYIIGSNGVVAAPADQLPGSAKLPTLIDESGFEAAPGKQVLGSEAIGFINSVLAQCKRAGVRVQSLTLPPLAQELHLQAADVPYFVKFNLAGDSLVQAGQYLAAKHKFDAENSQPSQYLDVRVAGKVYYK